MALLSLYGYSLKIAEYGYTVKEENTLARQYIDKALQIQLKVLGNNHPDVATSYINLGFSYLSTDEYDAAIQYLEKALQSWIQILGEKNSTSRMLLFIECSI